MTGKSVGHFFKDLVRSRSNELELKADRKRALKGHFISILNLGYSFYTIYFALRSMKKIRILTVIPRFIARCWSIVSHRYIRTGSYLLADDKGPVIIYGRGGGGGEGSGGISLYLKKFRDPTLWKKYLSRPPPPPFHLNFSNPPPAAPPSPLSYPHTPYYSKLVHWWIKTTHELYRS